MNAAPLLSTLLAAIHGAHLEVILIGNAVAAMHGAPVTTLDFDFMFRDTAVNLRTLKRVAAQLEATILGSFCPISKLYRMVDDATGWQADFMPVIHGVWSFEGLRSRAVERQVGRKRDLAVLPVLEKTRDALGGLNAAAQKQPGGRQLPLIRDGQHSPLCLASVNAGVQYRLGRESVQKWSPLCKIVGDHFASWLEWLARGAACFGTSGCGVRAHGSQSARFRLAMNILFDQGTPAPLRRHVRPYPVDTTAERNWSIISNGELFEEIRSMGFRSGLYGGR